MTVCKLKFLFPNTQPHIKIQTQVNNTHTHTHNIKYVHYIFINDSLIKQYINLYILYP